MRAKARLWTTQYRPRRQQTFNTNGTPLQDNSDELRLILDNVHDMVWWMDRNGVIRFLSPSVERVVGYTPEEFAGTGVMHSETFVHPDDLPVIFQAFQAALEMKRLTGRAEYRFKHRDGHYIWIETTAHSIPSTSGGLDGLIFVSRDVTERKQTEVALQESELRYRTLMHAMAEGVLLTDRDGVIIACNPAAEAIFDTSADRMIGVHRRDMNWKIINTEGERLSLDKSPTLDTLRTGIPHRNVLHGVVLQDGIRWISLNTQPLVRPGKTEPYAVVTSFSDITHLREVEIALREKQAEFEALITEYAHTQAIELKQRRLAEALTKTGVALAGALNLDEVLDLILTHVAEVILHDAADIMLIQNGTISIVRVKNYGDPQRDLERVLAPQLPIEQFPSLQRMAETAKPVIIDDCQSSSKWIELSDSGWIRSYLGVPIQIDGQTIGFLNINSAMPYRFTSAHAEWLASFATQAAIAIRNAQLYSELEQRVQERTAELDVARRRLQVILDATGEGIIYAEGNEIRYVNQMLCRLTGYREDELVGEHLQTLNSLTVNIDRARRFPQIEAMLRRGEIWRDEFRIRRKDGTEFDAGLTFSLLGDPDIEFLRTVIVVRDISQEKALQAQKARFVAHASHELRTPLANLITRLYLMQRQPQQMERHLAVLEEVAGRMRRLVEDLLEVSRFDKGIIVLRPQNVVLQDILVNVIGLQREEADVRNVTLDLDLPNTPLLIHADPERLNQVITNLVLNAIFYSRDGGCVTVRMLPEIDGDPPEATVIVEDDGIGIAPDHLPHLFEAFYRAGDEKGGTGLGLTIAKEIVELHGGSLSVESVPGQGNRFTLRLPALHRAGTS